MQLLYKLWQGHVLCVVQRIRTVSTTCTIIVLRAAALWIQMSSPCAATQRNIWDGVTEINGVRTLFNIWT